MEFLLLLCSLICLVPIAGIVYLFLRAGGNTVSFNRVLNDMRQQVNNRTSTTRKTNSKRSTKDKKSKKNDRPIEAEDAEFVEI